MLDVKGCIIKAVFLLLTILSLLSLSSCAEKAAESVEVKDLNRFDGDDGGSSVDETPTNADVSLTGSTVHLQSSTCTLGEEIMITLVAKDDSGTAIVDDGLTVTFEFVNDGTSSGTFTAVLDEGSGVYSSEITCDTVGSANSLRATIGGSNVTSSTPTLQVLGGSYSRTITLDTATDNDEYQVVLTLNSSNFTYSNADTNGDDLRFYDSSYTELDYYIETWDTSGDSTVWVKVQSSGTATFDMYYGNSTLAAASSKEGVFSYDVAKDIYYNVSQNANNQTLNISSYISNNDVTVGGTTNTISPYTPTSYNNISTGAVTVQGPISGRKTTSSGADLVIPVSFATMTMGYSDSRGTDDWDFYNPNASDALVTISNYDSSGVLQGSTEVTVSAGSYEHVDYNVDKMGLVESTLPVIGVYYYSNANDVLAMMRASTEIMGAMATGATIGITEDSTTGTIYYDDGTVTNFSGDKGDAIDLNSGGSQNSAEVARVEADKPIIGNSQADGDGSESTSFWPVDDLDNEYIFPTDIQYFIVACKDTVNLTLYDETDTIDTTATCTPAATSPGRVALGDASNLTYNAGSRIVGDGNFFVYYEYSTQDETNVSSWRHARSYQYPAPIPSVGSETSH